jgi:hypothetical protein
MARNVPGGVIKKVSAGKRSGVSWKSPLKRYQFRKENKIFVIYKEIQMVSGAKSFMRKGFLIYEEMPNFSSYMVRPLVIYDFAFSFLFYQCSTYYSMTGDDTDPQLKAVIR